MVRTLSNTLQYLSTDSERGLNHSGKPNSDLFESEEGVERAVDAPQRISLSDLEEKSDSEGNFAGSPILNE